MNSAIMMLERTAQRFGDRPAVRDGGESVTFTQLRTAALSAAAGLMAGEHAPGLPVIVYLPKGIQALEIFCGAMYAGCPYVPVDAAIPLPRLQRICDSLGAGHIVTSPELLPNLEGLSLGGIVPHTAQALLSTPPREAAALRRVGQVIDCDPIYLIFTSGSTGVPKGVTIPHRGILDYAAWLEETFHFDEHTVLGNQSAFFFDNSTLDIFTMLYTGATLVLIPEILFRFPSKLPEFINDAGINTIFWVPTVMIAVANSGALETTPMPGLKKVLFCGEAMPNSALNVWRRCHPEALYANLYGPTEITDVCTYYIVDRPFDDAQSLPIGRPCRNMRALVLREDGTQAAVNEPGELCIQGSALALGYWGAGAQTRSAFVQNPLHSFYDDRLYRTGDLAYVDGEGLLIFIGRKDAQVKLRGNRIELGDVETAARSLPEIENACVLLDPEAQELVLFAQSRQELKLRKVNQALRGLIPAYMLPGRLVVLEALPLTPNGKLDRVLLKTLLRERNATQ